ncbi:MAG: hypothetical protein ACFE0I_22185 [Elainellaceae cyanobacterium]
MAWRMFRNSIVGYRVPIPVLASGIGLVLAVGVHIPMAIALTPLTPPPDMALLNDSDAIPANPAIVTSDTFSQAEMTIPSLWWADDQFGGKLIENWAAYPITTGDSAHVDLVVNRQIWSLLSYLERYTVLSKFGTSARDFGYSTRIFNRQGEPLAAYLCTFPATVTTASMPSCQVNLDSSGAGAFRSRSNPFDAF